MFATLEEAWGLPRLGGSPNAAAVAASRPKPPLQHLQQHPLQQRPLQQGQFQQGQGQPGQRGQPGQFQPGQQTRAADDAYFQQARRYLANVYATHGMPGLMRVLPPSAAKGWKGKGPSPRHRRRPPTSLGDRVWEFVTSPEKMLVVLLAAFAVLVLMDAQSTARDAAMMSSLQLQHVHPFPMMPGMTLTSSG